MNFSRLKPISGVYLTLKPKITLIANLLLMVLQKRIKRNWSFSNLATMVRIMLMYYIDCYSFFEHPEKDWLKILDTHDNPPAEPSLFD